jgi:peptidoglycan/xylan/chitin deacetylase (PgdA/CDA1 family)
MVAVRMRKRVAIVFVSLICSLSHGQTKEVCFSIDDLPTVAYGVEDTVFQSALVDKLLGSLSNSKIPAIGFVNENKLYDTSGASPFQVGLLNRWIEHGFELGNHTYSHPDFNTVPCADFFEDILRGETITKELLSRKGKRIRYFRHPFLHVGNTKAKADSLQDFLATHGYRVAPVTIDNDDYLFAHAFAQARAGQDSALAGQIGSDYISYMQEKLRYFERQARALFGRDIRQILLIHASMLNAEYMDSLAAMYRKNGYRFITMDRAVEDEAYSTPVTAYGKWGISWIDRWAMSKGKPSSFFKDEPRVPEYLD